MTIFFYRRKENNFLIYRTFSCRGFGIFVARDRGNGIPWSNFKTIYIFNLITSYYNSELGCAMILKDLLTIWRDMNTLGSTINYFLKPQTLRNEFPGPVISSSRRRFARYIPLWAEEFRI